LESKVRKGIREIKGINLKYTTGFKVKEEEDNNALKNLFDFYDTTLVLRSDDLISLSQFRFDSEDLTPIKDL